MIRYLTVSTQARETRQGTKMIAKQMLRLIQRLHAIPVLDDYQSKIRKGEVLRQSSYCLCALCV